MDTRLQARLRQERRRAQAVDRHSRRGHSRQSFCCGVSDICPRFLIRIFLPLRKLHFTMQQNTPPCVVLARCLLYVRTTAQQSTTAAVLLHRCIYMVIGCEGVGWWEGYWCVRVSVPNWLRDWPCWPGHQRNHLDKSCCFFGLRGMYLICPTFFIIWIVLP